MSRKRRRDVTWNRIWCHASTESFAVLSQFFSLNNSSCNSISFSEYLTTRLILQVFEDFYSTKTCLRRIKGYAFLIDKLSFCNRWRTWNYKAAYEASRKRFWAKSKEEKKYKWSVLLQTFFSSTETFVALLSPFLITPTWHLSAPAHENILHSLSLSH